MFEVLITDRKSNNDYYLQETYGEMNANWLDLFDDPVLNDKMMTEAMTNPAVKTEHSYSIGKVTSDNTATVSVKSEPVITRHITLDEHTGPAINPVSSEHVYHALFYTYYYYIFVPVTELQQFSLVSC